MKATNETQAVRPYCGEEYKPLIPQPDSETLCEAGERVIFYHAGIGSFKHAELRIAPRGLFCSGWVIGQIS